MPGRRQAGEGAVVVAGTVAQTVPPPVEAEERRKDDLGDGFGSVGRRLHHAQGPGLERHAGTPGMERQRPLAPAHPGQQGLRTQPCRQCRIGRVSSSSSSDQNTETRGRSCHGTAAEHLPGDQLAGRMVLVWRMGSAPRLQLITEGRLAPGDVVSALAAHANRIQKR